VFFRGELHRVAVLRLLRELPLLVLQLLVQLLHGVHLQRELQRRARLLELRCLWGSARLLLHVLPGMHGGDVHLLGHRGGSRV
jgi:hypothetical protein